jgi:hypothetical protein
VHFSLNVTYFEQASKQRKCVESKFSAVKEVKSCTSHTEIVFVVL